MSRDKMVRGVTFSQLLQNAQRGDPGAIAELHRRYAANVHMRIRDRFKPALRRRYDTADLAQSVFAELLRDLPRVEDRGERAFRNWLYIKAEDKVRKRLRRLFDKQGRVRERTAAGADEVLGAPGPATSAEHNDDVVHLNRILATLAEVDRSVLLLRAQKNLPYAAVAKRLALPSADAARMRFARALLTLTERWSTT